MRGPRTRERSDAHAYHRPTESTHATSIGRARGCTIDPMPRGWVVLVPVVAALSGRAHAQQSDELGIERFRLSIDRAGMLDVEWAGVPGHLSWGAGVAVGFAHDPLVVYDRDMNAVDALVERRLTTMFVGSLALWNRLQLGASLDVVGYQRGSDVLGAMTELPSSGVGDLRLLA